MYVLFPFGSFHTSTSSNDEEQEFCHSGLAQEVHAEGEQQEFNYKSEEFKGVASQFKCTCGCGQDHYECDPNTCALTKDFKKDLVDMMNEGKDKDDIRAYYVNIYGEEILTAPEKKGFSLAAWVGPFVAIGAAGSGIFVVVRKWVSRKNSDEQNEEDKDKVEDATEDEIYKSMIDKERKKYF
jgi:cytochrome c-type biogenesis protein CcmH